MREKRALNLPFLENRVKASLWEADDPYEYKSKFISEFPDSHQERSFPTF